MVTLHGFPRRPLRFPACVAAVGIFDGVHRGHQAILRKAVTRARVCRGTPVAITFDPHPLAVLRPAAVPPLLMSLEQRLREFAQCGIQVAWVLPFTRSFSRWPPEYFVRWVLVRRLQVREMVVGHDFGFGAGRSGTIETLKQLAASYGFRTHVMPPFRMGSVRVSSRAIRELIRLGRLAQVRRMLGRPVSVVGRVIRGAGRGERLGFATANLKLEAGMLPPVGVYAVRARAIGRRYAGMANIGFRPTFKSPRGQTLRGLTPPAPLLEVHLFGVSRPLYGSRLEVEFHRWLRPERRFSSPQALARQLARDAARTKSLLTGSF